jgi:hypothetical protein
MSNKYTADSPFIQSAVRKSKNIQKAQEIDARRHAMIQMKVEGKSDAEIHEAFNTLSLKHVKREIATALRLSNKKAEKQAGQLRQTILMRYEHLYSIFYPVLIEQSQAEEMNYQNNVAFDNVMRILKEMRELVGTDPDKSLININHNEQNLTVVGDDDPRQQLFDKVLSYRNRAGTTSDKDINPATS